MRFADIAVLAQDMHDSMQTECTLHKVSVIRKSKSIISEVYRYYPSIKIDIHSTKHPDNKINGFYTRYKREKTIFIDIDINSKLNSCWSRMVASKELCHPIVDKKTSSLTTNIVHLVDLFINKPQNSHIDEEINSEYNAFYLAIEMLLPYVQNKLIIDNKLTAYQVAQVLSVPEKMVDLVRTSWYQKLRNEAYD